MSSEGKRRTEDPQESSFLKRRRTSPIRFEDDSEKGIHIESNRTPTMADEECKEEANGRSFLIQDLLQASKITRSFVCKVKKELLNKNNGDELAATRRRKQYRRRSAYSLRTPEFVRRVHGMVDENRWKSMHDILPGIFKCLKGQQYARNVVHQHLRYKFHTFLGEVVSLCGQKQLKRNL
ncbi:hypothetical protein ACTXT7_012401 [Hymenolepis weldensis]